FTVRRERVLPELRRSWAFGRWIVLGQLVGVVHGFVLYWLLAAMKGTTATGAFAACMTVVTLSNPFILGIANVLGPRAARAFTTGGPQEARDVGRKPTLLLDGVMTALAGLVALGGWLA